VRFFAGKYGDHRYEKWKESMCFIRDDISNRSEIRGQNIQWSV